MKKTLLLILLVFTVFFPPISINMAIKAAWNIRQDEVRAAISEKLAAEIQTIDRSFDEAEWMMRNLVKLYANVCNQDGDKFVRQQLPAFIKTLSFPVEIECVITDINAKNKPQHLYFGHNLGLKNLANQVAGQNEVASDSQMGRMLPLLKNTLAKIRAGIIDEVALRDHNSSLFVSGKRISENIYVFALAQLKQMNSQKSLLNRIRSYENSEVGVGAVIAGNATPGFSTYFKTHPEIRKSVLRRLAQNNLQPVQYSEDKHEIYVGSYDSRKQCRFFAVIPSLHMSGSGDSWQSIVLAILWLFSCVIFKILLEKIVIGRGPDLSIKVLLPVIFLFLIILPVFAGACLIGDFFHSNYADEKHRVTEHLAEEIKEIDLSSLDMQRGNLNRARSFSSIEGISSYTEILFHNNEIDLCCELLTRLLKEAYSNNSTTIWFCPDKKKIVNTRWDANSSRFIEDNTKNPVIQMFEARSQEILDEEFGRERMTRQAKQSGLNSEIKGEVTRDFFLKLIGPEVFYRFRQNSDIVFYLNSKFRQSIFYMGQVSRNAKPYALVAWQMRMGLSEALFPMHLLKTDLVSPRLAFSGDENTFASVKFPLAVVNQMLPELVRIGQLAHISRARVTSRVEHDQQTIISEALPGNYSFKTIAGSEILQSYELFAQGLTEKSLKLLVALISLGFLFAFAGAIYFTAPLRELTKATQQIALGDFSCRINQDHPDEFSDIGMAFNAMARGLDEGQRLRSYVSDSVIREVEGNDETGIAERAEARCATIIFSAICGFAEFQKNHSAGEVFNLLQTHLQAADQATQKYGGEIDKMIEDKVMIVFEHDENQSVTADAVNVAIYIADLMAEMAEIKIGAGINTGITVAGVMGAESARLSRTVVGDPVNLAARLASLSTKRSDGGIIISGQLKANLPDGYAAEKLPISNVKGKTHTVEAYLVQKIQAN